MALWRTVVLLCPLPDSCHLSCVFCQGLGEADQRTKLQVPKEGAVGAGVQLGSRPTAQGVWHG